MRAQILEKLNDLKIKSGKSFESAHEELGFATSTIHRWHKGESEPDLEQLTKLVEYYGGSMEDLFAAVGKQELTATQAIGYQGADVMVEHYEQRLKSKDEKYDLLQAHHEQRVIEINDNHKRSVEYLLKEIDRLKSELDIANKAAIDLAKAATDLAESNKSFSGKKHIVFWVLGATNVVLAVLLFFALRTGPIF